MELHKVISILSDAGYTTDSQMLNDKVSFYTFKHSSDNHSEFNIVSHGGDIILSKWFGKSGSAIKSYPELESCLEFLQCIN